MISKSKYLCDILKCSSLSSRPALMITLTSAGVVDSSDFWYELDKFVKKLKRYLKCNQLDYICVREVQKRGVFHYHMVLFNFNFIDFNVVSAMWKLGFVWLSWASGREAVAYILKYVSKDEDFGGRLHASYSMLKIINELYLKDTIRSRFHYWWCRFNEILVSRGVYAYGRLKDFGRWWGSLVSKSKDKILRYKINIKFLKFVESYVV